MRRKLLQITGELLLEMFRRDDRQTPGRRVIFEGMPADARLIAVAQSGHEWGSVDVSLVIESDTFPETEPDKPLEALQLIARTEADAPTDACEVCFEPNPTAVVDVRELEPFDGWKRFGVHSMHFFCPRHVREAKRYDRNGAEVADEAVVIETA